MSIGKNIAIFRKGKGLTQAELGDLIGVSNQAVSKWESEMTMPDVMILPTLADVFGCYIDELFSREVKIKNRCDYSAELPWNDDEVIRGVVFQGKKILKVTDYPVENITFEIEGNALCVSSEANIIINGNVVGGCTSEGNISVRGNITGECISNGNIEAKEWILGECTSGGNITVGGNITGECTAGENITAGGKITGACTAYNVMSGDDLSEDVCEDDVLEVMEDTLEGLETTLEGVLESIEDTLEALEMTFDSME